MGGQKNGFEISNYIMQYEQDKKDMAYHISQQSLIKNRKVQDDKQKKRQMPN